MDKGVKRMASADKPGKTGTNGNLQMITLPIKIACNDDLLTQFPSVSLQDLHLTLGVNEDFESWVSFLMRAYLTKEGVDHIVIRCASDWPIYASVNVAKIIAADTHTERGEEVWRYLNEIDKPGKTGIHKP